METRESTSTACAGASHNCALLVAIDERHAVRCEEAAISGSDAMLSAMAVGLVIEVWRNSPVENMHAGRRGPSDATMFAESTDLHRHAVKALTVSNRSMGLLDLEYHLLDRSRPWAATGGENLTALGYGFLGDYRKHVKDRINVLMALSDHTCVADPAAAYLVARALTYGRNHKGMPEWPAIVARIGLLLADPNHPEWRDPARGANAIATMPPSIPEIDELTGMLLDQPSDLPVDVLEWLTDHLLHCAGPPYGPSWRGVSGDPASVRGT
jgi:hypothetical protein